MEKYHVGDWLGIEVKGITSLAKVGRVRDHGKELSLYVGEYKINRWGVLVVVYKNGRFVTRDDGDPVTIDYWDNVGGLG